MRIVVLTIVVLGILAGLGGLLVMYSGVINVGADAPNIGAVEWVLGTSSDRSIERHASGKPPSDLTASQTLLLGAAHYKAMCVVCHGAPGVEPSEISQGLNPEAPDLKDAGANWPDARIYWVVKHGIRMTGMPAFGKTHGEKELWAMVAFVKKYPSLTPESYQALMKKAPNVE